jgi:hypothetical protein
MDVARKYLPIGRRYARCEGGNESLPGETTYKSQAAGSFREKWRTVTGDEKYCRLKYEHRRRNE